MSNRPDETIPFDASVVDEEALRALRAVQRTLPLGGDGTSSNLVGGVVSKTLFGAVQRGAEEGAALPMHEEAAQAASHATTRQDEPLKALELPPSDRKPILVNFELPEAAVPASAARAPVMNMRPGITRSSSSVVITHDLPASSSQPVEPAATSNPPEQPTIPKPPVEQPTEEQPDILASTPKILAIDAQGDEDQEIALNLTAALADTDGSESLSIKILGVPDGAVLSHGHRERDGSWSVTASDLAHLTITPPHDFSGDIKLTLRVTAHESNGSTATAESAFVVHVSPIADAPYVTVADAHGSEDSPVALDGLGGRLRDTDGSETLSFILSGLPDGATLSTGTNLGGGRWALTEAQLTGLTLNPPENASGTYTLTLTAVASERVGGSTATTPSTFTLVLDPVVDQGQIGGTSTGREDAWIALQPTFDLEDRDGSEQWGETTTVSGVPVGAVLNQGREVRTGVWEVSTAALQAGEVAVRPPVNSDRDFPLDLETRLIDRANGTSSERVVTGVHEVHVTAVADAPAVHAADAAGREDEAIALDLRAGLTDGDGSETLSVVIVGVPKGAQLSAGTVDADGNWHVEAGELEGLTLTPPANFSGTIDLKIVATSREGENDATATVEKPFQVLVDGEANAPEVSVENVTGTEDEDVALKLSAALTDKDGSEELVSVKITGLPPGASLSKGSRAADDSWVVDPAYLSELVLTPPPNYSGTMNLTVHVTSQEAANGSVATTDMPFKVHVNAVADHPDVTAENASGKEDAAIALKLTAELTDTDESEVLSVAILNVPPGATLSHGKLDSENRWIVAPADLEHLTITPPRNFSGTINLVLESTAREVSNDSVATSRTPFKVDVEAVADAPEIIINGASGKEDHSIPLNVATDVTDQDGSEEISSVVISGVPTGFTLTHGVVIGTGTWKIDPAELANVAIVPPKDYSGSFSLTIETTSRELSNGSEAVSKRAFPVMVEAVPDMPTVGAHDASGKEDTRIALDLSAGLTDLDGSEVLSIVVRGLPSGTTLSAGRRNSDGSWTLTPVQLSGLTMMPPSNWSGTRTVTVEAHSRETSNNLEAVNTTTFKLEVTGVADAPTITAKDVSGNEDEGIALGLKINLVDTDNSETLSVVISGVPDGATLSHGTFIGNNSWSVPAAQVSSVAITPPHDFSGDIKLTVHATAKENNGDTAVTEKSLTVAVNPIADAPYVTVADAHGSEDSPVALDGLGGRLRDTDGSETLSFILSGLPDGATLSTGTNLGGGRWALTEAQLTGLTLNPPENASGTYTLTLTAVASERVGGSTATTPSTFTLVLDPVVDGGQIGGASTGREDEWITLQPTFDLEDRDGSESWGETTTVSGVPVGAVLNQGREVRTGVWEVSTAALQAGEVAVRPPVNSDRDFPLDLETRLIDRANGTSSERVVTGVHEVQVHAVADAPAVHAADAAGREDEAIALDLRAGLTDGDGSETLSVVIVGVPKGAQLSAGTVDADGNWHVEAGELEGLTLTPARDFSGTIDLKIIATSKEDANKDEAKTEAEFHVKVDAVADAPGVRVSPAIGDEDSEIPLHVSAWTTDRDGSESIVGFHLTEVPDGAIVTAGGVVIEKGADGKFFVSPDAIGTLTITPPPQSDERFTIRVSAISAEPNGSEQESDPIALPVIVRAVADKPVLTNPSASGLEDNAIALNLAATTDDQDGSEIITFVISDLPPGAVLSEGTYKGKGAWSLTAEQAARVTITPAPDYSGTFELSVTAISQERNGGDQEVTSVKYPVHVKAVVDTPAVGGLGTDKGNWGTRSGPEDQPIELKLDPGLSDRDGSEKVVGDITIGGVPAGAVMKLADGTPVEPVDGVYTIRADQMAGVTLTMPPDSDEKATLTIKMTVEDKGGVRETIGGTMVVDAIGDADMPKLELEPSSGTGHTSIDEAQGQIPLHIVAQTTDKDDSETLHMLIQGVPPGASLSAGSPVGNGMWLVPTDALGSLSIRPAYGFSGTFDLKVTAIAVEREGDRQPRTESLTVTVTAPGGGTGGTGGTGDDGSGGQPPSPKEAQPPKLVVSDVVTDEDHKVSLFITAETNDGDNGREMLGVRIQGVPKGASLSVGIQDPDTGDWLLQPSELGRVQITPPANYSGTISLTVNAIAQEATGHQATTTDTLNVVVTPVVDQAAIGAHPSAGVEDQPVALNLSVELGDKDGSETITSVVLSHISPGGTIVAGPGITDNHDGTWTVELAHVGSVQVLPLPNRDGPFEVRVSVSTRENASGETTTAIRTVKFDVAPEADAPNVTAHDASGKEDSRIDLDLSASLNDTDGSEVLSIVIDGLPPGAILSKGVNNGDGSWTLTPEQLTGLAVTPPADWSGSMDLTVVAYARERTNGSVESRSANFHVQVDAAADAPLVSARDVTGKEDDGIPLNLSALSIDRDGSETLYVVISGVPDGATLSHGTFIGNNSWSVPAAQVSSVAITPPHDFSGDIKLTLQVTAHESNGSTATAESAFVVHVSPIADAPYVTVADAHGSEDSPVALDGLGGRLRDTDGSETLSFILSGLPDGATLSTGTNLGGGRWALTEAQLTGLTLNPPENASGTYTLTLTAVASERVGGSTATTPSTFTLVLDPVVDGGQIGGASTGREDEWITLQPTFDLEDRDGSESWGETTTVSGVPVGAVLNQGREVRTGVWEVSTAALQAGEVAVRPPVNSDRDFPLDLETRLIDRANGTSSERVVTGVHEVHVTAVADAPAVTAADAAGREDEAIALDLRAGLTDGDGSETLSVVIVGVPKGAQLSAGTVDADGNWHVEAGELEGLTLTPPANFSGTIDLKIVATSREGENDATFSTEAEFHVDVQAVADAPLVEVANVTGQEDGTIALNLSVELSNPDGSEQLSSVILSGLSDKFTLSHATFIEGDRWQVPIEHLSDLRLTPPQDWNGTLNLTLHATTMEPTSGSVATTSSPFTVTFEAVNDAPELSLAAPAHGEAGATTVGALGSVEAHDVDSTYLDGATVTLTSAYDGDKLDLSRYTLHAEDGRTMIGDTGIEIVGGGYDPATGKLTLSGHASPETYAEVLQSLVLESADGSGLSAGARSIAVTLQDQEGLDSISKTVDVVLDEPLLPQDGLGHAGLGAPPAEPMQTQADSDVLLLMASDGSEAADTSHGTWTEQVDHGSHQVVDSHPAGDLDQPVSDQVQSVNDFHVEIGRLSWS